MMHDLPDTTLVARLRDLAWRDPERLLYTFLDDEGAEAARLDAGGLDRRARTLAERLRRLDGAGERVLLLLSPGLDFIAAFMGCLYAGAVAVPASPPRRRDAALLAAIAADAEPRVIVVGRELSARLEEFRAGAAELARAEVVILEDAVEGEPGTVEPDAVEPGTVEPAVEPGDLAFLQYTSGSTSRPKGVMVTHGNLVHNEELIRRAFEQTPESVIVSWLPLYHDMGLIGGALQPLYLGARAILMAPASFLRRPAGWLEAISRYGATTSGGPDFAYALCANKIGDAERRKLDLSSWRVAFNGAEPVRAGTLKDFAATFEPQGFDAAAFYPCYGLAEATLFVRGGAVAREPAVRSFDAVELENHRAVPGTSRALVSCGATGQETRIVDPEGRHELGAGEVGEIWVRGPSVARGYWDDAEQTARAFEARLADREEGGFLRTGDLGFLHDGELFITGRIKDLIILRGRNLYPHDLERTVERSHADLRPGLGAVFAIEAMGEERLVVVHEVERHALRKSVEEHREILEAARRAVAEEHEANALEVVLIRTGSLPRTSSGKVRRAETRARYLADELAMVARDRAADESETAAAETPEVPDLAALAPAEQRGALIAFLRHAAAAVLRVAPAEIVAERSLTSLGLDSLASVELRHAVERELGVALEADVLLEGPSLERLAEIVLESESAAVRDPAIPVPDDTNEWPVSHGQAAFLFLDRLAPGHRAYVIAAAGRTRGHLETELLHAATVKLAERHPALRTVFVDVDGEPRQRVLEASPARVDFAFEDLAPRGLAIGDPEFQARLDEAVWRPFDLARGPLFRLGVFRLAADEHVLFFALHHTIADQWSLAVLLRELDTLLAGGLDAALPGLPAGGFGAAVEHRRRQLAGERGEITRRFWATALDGCPTVLELPTDRPRPLEPSFDGAVHGFRIEASLFSSARLLAKRHKATPYAVLLAVYQALLGRYSGQEDLLVGSPHAGRESADLAGLVGYLVNPVVLRGQPSAEISFGDFLARTRAVARAAFAHADHPFPLLVEELDPRREAGRSPLVQVLFAFQSAPAGAATGLAAFGLGAGGARLEIGGLELESVPLEHPGAQFDLSLQLAEDGDAFAAAWLYNRGLFEAATLDRMAGHFNALLRSAVGDENRPLGALDYLSEAEIAELTAHNEAPYSASRGTASSELLHELLAMQARRTPERPALIFEGEELTYGELQSRAMTWARQLVARGVRPESRVAIHFERSFELLIAQWAVLAAGGAYLPLDPAYPRQRLEYVLEDSGAQFLIHGEDLPQLSPERTDLARLHAADLDAGPATMTPLAETAVLPALDGENAAYVLYTSGSTGRPKGAVNRHRSIVNRLLSMQETYALGEDDRVLQKTPVGFDVSVWEFHWPLLAGATLVLARPGGHQDSRYLARLIRDAGITTLHFVPSMLEIFLEEDELDAGSVPRRVIASGEALYPELVRRFFERLPGAELHNLYGPTEAAIDVTAWPCSPEDERPFVPIGSAVHNTHLHVVDRALRRVAIGIAGELLLGGVQLARGYLERPALTAERFVPDPHPPRGEAGGRVYRTGDLVSRLGDGTVRFLGRIDHQIKLRGQRIELGEIEARLEELAAVRRALVLDRRSARGETRLVAWVVPSGAAGAVAELESEALRHELRDHLTEVMLPSAFVFLDALPLLPNGKVDRRALPEPEWGSSPRADRVLPRNETEKAVAAMWAELLELPDDAEIGVHDDFFSLGGHSLLSLHLASKIRDAFGVELPMRTFLDEAATVEKLAATIDEQWLLASDEAQVEDLLGELDHLSEEEIERMLAEEEALG